MEQLTKTALQQLEKCIETGKKVGSPRDQVLQFISHKYIPYPWQWKFHAAAREADKEDGPVDIGLGGARGPGKSHAVLAQAGIDDCQRVDGLKCLFLRQTGISAQESFDDLVQKVLKGRIGYAKSGNILRFSNGSRILLGGFHDERDIDKYIGIEYDLIIVEELTQLTEDKYTKLRGSLRTSKDGWRPRMYTSFNPGGTGHAFVKERYIIPYRKREEKETRFIGATYKDNPGLNKEYIGYLESLTGDLGKAWREGEWDIFAGQFFQEWREGLHVCQSFLPNTNYIIVGGMDWGRAKPFSFHLAQVNRVLLDDGRKFFRVKVFLEVYGTDKTPAEWFIDINKQLRKYKIKPDHIAWIQGDPAMYTKGQDKSKSIRDQFIDANSIFGYKIKPASNDRIGGWTNYHNWLRIAPDGQPYYLVAENCINLIRTLPELIHDENKVEDVDSDSEDHAADDQRYMLKKIKWIDAGVGKVIHPIAKTQYMQIAPHFINHKQLSVDLDIFAEPEGTNTLGAIVRN